MGRVHRHATLFAANNVGCQAPIPRPFEGTRTRRVNGLRKTRPTGRAGFDIVPHQPPGTAEPSAQCHTGLPREARLCLVLPAQRQAAGALSAWSQPFRSTHERPRRWGDAGALERQSVPAPQKAGVDCNHRPVPITEFHRSDTRKDPPRIPINGKTHGCFRVVASEIRSRIQRTHGAGRKRGQR